MIPVAFQEMMLRSIFEWLVNIVSFCISVFTEPFLTCFVFWRVHPSTTCNTIRPVIYGLHDLCLLLVHDDLCNLTVRASCVYKLCRFVDYVQVGKEVVQSLFCAVEVYSSNNVRPGAFPNDTRKTTCGCLCGRARSVVYVFFIDDLFSSVRSAGARIVINIVSWRTGNITGCVFRCWYSCCSVWRRCQE